MKTRTGPGTGYQIPGLAHTRIGPDVPLFGSFLEIYEKVTKLACILVTHGVLWY